MSELVVPCVPDALARPRWWRDGAMIGGCFALWLAAGMFSSMGPTALVTMVGWFAYLFARSRIALSLRVGDAFVSHSGHRVPLAGAELAVRAWTGPGGSIGSVLSIGTGRRGILVGCKGVNVACADATSEVDVVVDASDFNRLVRRLAPTLDASIYRQAVAPASRRVWANPAVRGGGWALAASGMFVLLAAMIQNQYAALSGLWLAFTYSVTAAWLVGRAPFDVTQRALVLTGRSVRLEASVGTALWTVVDAPKRARVSGSGDAQTLELDPRSYPLRRIARGGLVREHEEISAHVSAEDFDALVLALGLGPPRTRVERDAEDDIADDAREERKRNTR